MRVRSRLRYLLTHDERFALWNDDGVGLAGLADQDRLRAPGFLAAGGTNTVVSQWMSESTAMKLMIEFHRQYQRGATPTGALRMASSSCEMTLATATRTTGRPSSAWGRTEGPVFCVTSGQCGSDERC